MTKTVIFNPTSELAALTVPSPKPAENYMPKWLKQIMPFHTNPLQFNPETGAANVTVKKCMPFADSFSMGYIQETWVDIWIEKKENQTIFYYPSGPKIMDFRPAKSTSYFPRIEEYVEEQFTWHPPWWPQLPPGYSCILTHPFNHDELPFHTFTGILDTDTFQTCSPVASLPFMLKEKFSGMIKKGTPMYQIIPFKRECWESTNSEYDEKKQITIVKKVKQHFWDGYKKLHWKKKQFK